MNIKDSPRCNRCLFQKENCYNLLSIVYEMTDQARLPLVVEVIPAFKIELAHVQSQQLCPFDEDFSL